MTYPIFYEPEADDVLDGLAASTSGEKALRAIERKLDDMAEDPHDRKLGTRCFKSGPAGGLCATPVGYEDWWIIWHKGENEEGETVDVIYVSRLDL